MNLASSKWVLYFWGSLLPCLLFAQQDTIVIEAIEVNASKIRTQNIGGQSQQWTTASLNQLATSNISDLLQQEGSTFIKSYGLGSLATSSIRGGSAGHTLVLWNGLPLQSPMLGLLDLSLLPLNAVEEVSLQKGGNSALWGSGAIGGTIGMNNTPNFSNQLHASLFTELGSFRHWQQQAKIQLGNSKFQSHTKLFHRQAENNFKYNIAPNFPKREQSNARLSQQNFLQDFYWRHQKHQFAAHYWYQQSDRQIPPTNVQTRSTAHQNDIAHRAIINWQYAGNQHLLQAKIGFFKEQLDYFDDQILLKSKSQFATLFAEFSNQWQWKNKHQLYLGTTQSFTKATSTVYQNQPIEHRLALMASHQMNHRQWAVQSSLRQELVDGDLAPLVPILGIEYQLLPFLQAKFKISENYRLPTLNDRYWSPGGNENLLPENGWSEEINLLYESNSETIKLSVATTFFNRNINNWILWSIQEGQQFWSANNITKVWSRGLEQRLSLDFRKILNLAIAYDYIRSTNQVALEFPRIAAGTQLFYTPEHQGFIKAKFQWRDFQIAYQHKFTGTSLGINENLPAYQVANTHLQYQLQKGKYNGQLFCNINNIWNTDYFIIERRPMPGRHYTIGIRLTVDGGRSTANRFVPFPKT